MYYARPLLLLLSFSLASLPTLGAAQRTRRPPATEPTPPPEPPTPSPEEVRDEQARALFEQGRTAFAEARFADALEFFRRAHALSQRHVLLYNIGQAADRLRLDREALEAFDLYLAEVPDAPNRVEVETRVGVLRETIAREEALRAEAARPASADESPIETQWWFWTLIGLGVAGAGVGVAAGLGAFNSTELAPQTIGDIGPGGVVIALEVRQ
jgi:tetratricopeptide (TPR) repeat protein